MSGAFISCRSFLRTREYDLADITEVHSARRNRVVVYAGGAKLFSVHYVKGYHELRRLSA